MAIGTKSSVAATQEASFLGRIIDWRWGLLSLWLAATALFLGRSIAGHFIRPLPSLALIALTVAAVVVSIELRALLRGSGKASINSPSSTTELLAQLLPTLGLMLLATGFTVAGPFATGLTLLWVLVAAEAALGAAGPWTLPLLRGGFTRQEKLAQRDTLAEPVAQRNGLTEPVAGGVAVESEASELTDELPWLWQDADALQELRYLNLPEQGLCVAGSQRVLLPATQTTAVVHTVLHPPFETTPLVTIEMQEPDAVMIKAAQILSHGIRWELRAEQPTEQPREVRWAFSVLAPSVPRG